MKTLGLIGGTGPESTVAYYKELNRGVQRVTGRSDILPRILINSIDMYEMFRYIESGNMDILADWLSAGFTALKNAGADILSFTAITPHIVYEKVCARTGLDIVDMREITAAHIKSLGITHAGLMGTLFTMEHDFVRRPMLEQGISIAVPAPAEMAVIHDTIVDELELGQVRQESKKRLTGIIESLIAKESLQAMVLGCTELPLMFSEGDLSVPVIDPVELHITYLAEKITDPG